MSNLPPAAEPKTSEASVKKLSDVSRNKFVPVRLRAYLLGIICLVLVCAIVAYSELIASRGGSVDAVLLGATHMPPGAIGVLIVIILGNSLVKRVSNRFSLNPAELAVMYFMMVCAALLSSFGLATQLLPNLVGINYYASTQDHIWRDTFYPHISKYLVPWDPTGPEKQEVSTRFFEGLRLGETIPWANWIIPVIMWLIFAFLLFFLMACVATLVRRQWVDNEKLTFPLVTLPMEMINEDSGKSFFRNKAMWAGFALPLLVHGLNGLHKNFPSVPELPIFFDPRTTLVTPPWNQMMFTPIQMIFSIVGFSYFLPLDVTFSMWFFLLFFRFQDAVALFNGHHLDNMKLYGGSRFYQGYQSIGAFIAIAITMIWLARPHLKLVKDRVFGNGGVDIDSNEYMRYRTAFWGGVISFLLIIAWLTAAGMTPPAAIFMVGVFVFIVMIVLTRCVAEFGLLMLQPVFRPLDLYAAISSKASLGTANLTVMSFVNGIFMRDPRNVMPAFLDSMKASDVVNVKKRNMAIGVLIAVGIGAFITVIIQLQIIYTKGGNSLNSWFMRNNPVLYFNESQQALRGTDVFDYRAPIWMGIGTIFTFFLYAMRSRFWWWPFHPLGYAMGACWPALVYWSSFFVGWLAKSLIIKYGGARTYRNFRPFFLGLILGEFSMGIFYALMSGLLGWISPAISIS